jgi:hypothetical protein
VAHHDRLHVRRSTASEKKKKKKMNQTKKRKNEKTKRNEAKQDEYRHRDRPGLLPVRVHHGLALCRLGVRDEHKTKSPKTNLPPLNRK